MIIVDVETTGYDAKKHSIVSIGAIDLENPDNQFYVENRIWDGSEIFEKDELLAGLRPALDINGFTVEQIKDKSKLSVSEAVKLFLEWSEGCNIKLIAGHNPYMDLEFLRNSALMHNIKWTLGYRTIDLHTAVYLNYKNRGLNPPVKLRAEECFNYVGLPDEPRPHNALNGAKFEAEAFSRLIYGRNLLKEFEIYPLPDYLKK